MPPGHRTTGQSRPGSGTQFDRPGHPVCAVPSQLPLLTRAPSNGNERGPINPAAGTKKAAHSWTATNIIPDFGTNDKTEHLFHSLLYRAPIDYGGALAMETARFRDIYNRIRPHQSLGDRTPRDAYLGITGGASVWGTVTETQHRAGLTGPCAL